MSNGELGTVSQVLEQRGPYQVLGELVIGHKLVITQDFLIDGRQLACVANEDPLSCPRERHQRFGGGRLGRLVEDTQVEVEIAGGGVAKEADRGPADHLAGPQEGGDQVLVGFDPLEPLTLQPDKVHHLPAAFFAP